MKSNKWKIIILLVLYFVLMSIIAPMDTRASNLTMSIISTVLFGYFVFLFKRKFWKIFFLILAIMSLIGACANPKTSKVPNDVKNVSKEEIKKPTSNNDESDKKDTEKKVPKATEKQEQSKVSTDSSKEDNSKSNATDENNINDEVSSDTTDSSDSDVFYKNCSAVKAAGKAPLHKGDAGYSEKLDRDKDGVACDN